MTEELAAQCQPYGCTKDKHIDKFFREEYSDYEYQMLGKTYCFVTRDRQKMVAAFSLANSSVRVDNMPKSSVSGDRFMTRAGDTCPLWQIAYLAL